ncbi:hypothetical protein PGB90_001366 [Kerria lacca]
MTNIENMDGSECQYNYNMKYILVTGGVISGIGKGIIASSLGTILKSCKLNVTAIKIDPYINIDAGTFSPYEHGEVYVLDDGSEVDLDLGNYERFLDVTLHKDNNITTGKVYQNVINKERKGLYLGKTVQVVPHITDEIQEWVKRVANIPVSDTRQVPDICVIELGGTIGDIEGMPFIEAFRQFQFRIQPENFCLVHVSLVPQPKSVGESKTKPTQSSVRELRSLGLAPDIIICRSGMPIDATTKEKISNFCNVSSKQIISIYDVNSIYKVPLLMKMEGIMELFNYKLKLNTLKCAAETDFMREWKILTCNIENLKEEVSIALVGKYTKLEDSYASVIKALQHAALHAGYKLKLHFINAEHLEKDMLDGDPEVQKLFHKAWKKINNSNGVVVPGGFGKRGIEGKIVVCEYCRKNKIPFLGICLGLQVAVIEFARNVVGLKNADSAEFKDTKEDFCHIITDMPEHNTGIMGGTMRLGKRKTFFLKEKRAYSVLYHLYKRKDVIEERHRHRFEVNKEYVEKIEREGMCFVATDESNERMEILELGYSESIRSEIEHLNSEIKTKIPLESEYQEMVKRLENLQLKKHPYFVATQFHPEYLSRPLKPSPPFSGLILAAKKKLDLSY